MKNGGSYRMPNEGNTPTKSNHAVGSNQGPNTGLRMEKGSNQGATKKPNSKNPYPNGLA